MPQPRINPHLFNGQTVTALFLTQETREEKVSDQLSNPTWRSAWVGELAASRRVTVLPVQNGRNWLYASTSAIRGYSDWAGYLLLVP